MHVEKLKNIDLNLLWALDALLDEVSVTRAAARLGLSAPAVSHALARLREELGDPLLVRAGREMVPTERARQLRPRVRAVLDEARGVFSSTEAFSAERSTRRFLLHGSDYVILVVGPPLDRALRIAAPGVEVQFMPNSAADADLVRAGEVELAIGVYHDLHPEIRIQKLFDEELVCVVRDDHPVVRKRMSLEQYVALAHVQIAPRGLPGGRIDATLARRGLRRRVVRRVPFFFAGMVLVADTDYALTVPHRLACAHAATFGLRIVALPLGLDRYAISQIWHPRHDGDAGHRWFRERVVEACAASRPRRR